MIRQLYVLMCVLIVSVSCKQSADNEFQVNVTFSNAQSAAFVGDAAAVPAPARVSKVYLYEVPFGNSNPPVMLDSAIIKENKGGFGLTGSGREQGLYQLQFDNGHVVLLTNDADNINVEIDFAKKDNYYSVSGSEASAQMKDFASVYTDHSMRVNSAFSELDSLKQFAAPDSLVMEATDVKNQRLSELNAYLRKFIGETTHPAVAIFALGMASRSFSNQEFETSLQKLVAKFPEHKPLAELKASYDTQRSQLAEESSWIGKPAPDIVMPDVNGKEVSLSSFRGKYVLVDFWASWCKPCRDENPNIVKAYNGYKNKNFTILGVSLDKEREPWLAAIQNDKLAWTHISDLQYWNSKAVALYHFRGIPYNVLIDPQGKIIAEGLRGPQLEEKLREVLP